MLWALREDDVSEGAGASTLRALGLLNNTAEESSPCVMVPLRRRGHPGGG